MTGSYSGGPFEIKGRPKPADWMEVESQYLVSSPGYLRAMSIPLLAGRDLDDTDTATAPPVALISQALERRYFRGENPVGHRIRLGDRWWTIVGVTGSVKRFSRSREAGPQIYLPAAQVSDSGLWIVVRTAGDPAQLARLARDAVRELDPNLPVIKMGTMREVQEQSLAEERLMTTFLAAFAGFAVVIAAIGIYGLIAFAVAQRTHEIGVRLALGASFGDVLAMVVRNGIVLGGAGVLVGLPLAAGAAKFMASLLYGVSPLDATIFLGVPALLVAVAALASFLPARRAAKLDPMSALRVE